MAIGQKITGGATLTPPVIHEQYKGGLNNYTIMTKAKSANEYGNKTKSRIQQIKEKLESVITDETLAYIDAEKKRALDESEEYQTAKEKLDRIKDAVLRPVTNRIFAAQIAKAMLGESGFPSVEKLIAALCDENGTMYKKGKSISVSTIREGASFYAEWEKGTIKTVRTIISNEEKAYKAFLGALAVGLFTPEECMERAGTLYGFNFETMDNIIDKFEKKEKGQK